MIADGADQASALVGATQNSVTRADVPTSRSPYNRGMRSPTMIRGARLFDGAALRQGRGVGVLVGDGRITNVDLSGAAPPDGAHVVELGDVTLLPGLVDAPAPLLRPR
jgi:imidazolonepropionase-like amidohydrolase